MTRRQTLMGHGSVFAIGKGGDPSLYLTKAGNLEDIADFATARANLGLEIGVDVQSYDADLAAIAALSSAGIIARTGAGTAAARTITGTSNQVNVANGDGVSGNPTLSLPQSINVGAAVTFSSLTLDGASIDSSGNGTLSGGTQNIGNNSAATLLDVKLRGGSDSGVGVLTRYVKGGSDKFYFGHDSAVNGGTGDGPALYANTGLGLKLYTNAALLVDFGATTVTLSNGVNIVVNTSTGTKIGTATNQKLGLWNATPVVQPTTSIAAAAFVANSSGIVDDTATFDGYTVGQVVKALRTVGMLA